MNLCMTIAERVALMCRRNGLFDLRDGSPAYIVRRFDRTPTGQKLRCENFVQILGEDNKYSGSVDQIGKRIRALSSVPGLDAQLFFERVLLNFLLGNGDAHLKNFSLLETENGRLRLSSAYDIVCSKAVIPKETDFAITLNGKADKITRKDFEKFSEGLKNPAKVVVYIFERSKRAHSMVLEEISHSGLSAEMQEKMRNVVEERRKRIFE
jgi:serine/threonine-protein kinase HipA